MQADIFDLKSFATEIPESQKEVSLLGAAGLIPFLAEAKDQVNWLNLLRIDDDVVRTWSLTKIFQHSKTSVSLSTIELAMRVAPYSAYLRRKLLPKLIESFRFDLVDELIRIEKEQAHQEESLHSEFVKATFENNYELLLKLHERLYLWTGDEDHLKATIDVAVLQLGWKSAVKPFLRNIFTQQQSLQALGLSWLRCLERENAQEEFKLVGSLFKKLPSCKICTAYVAAKQYQWDGEYHKCINFLTKSNLLKVAGDKAPFLWHMAAEAAEKSGDMPLAAEFYQKQNDIHKSDHIRPDRFIKELKARATWVIGTLPRDPYHNHLIMTGFPRSGTTLLENALASHPLIETCEETSSLLASVQIAYKMPLKKDLSGDNLNLRAQVHRQLYYSNLARFVRKKRAKIIIDKTPIMSANIKYLEKLFPSKRYIFSIRHPYDVVLSNYKQDYAQNIAMAAFNDIYDASYLYNHVMSDWFDVFPGNTDRVHYVKYDELVTDFDRVMHEVLEFVGVDWSEEVTHFASHSSERPVRTPSYTNVRKGLTIGIQSSWHNFEFLFDDRCRQLLDPWVTRFGYDS